MIEIKSVTATDTNGDYRNGLKIMMDDSIIMSFIEGEPEDATLNRDYSSVYDIISYLEYVYKAGKGNKDVLFCSVEMEWDDFCEL